MRKPSFWRLGIGVCATAITAVVLGGTPASADPVQSPQAVTGTLSCNDISVDVVIRHSVASPLASWSTDTGFLSL